MSATKRQPGRGPKNQSARQSAQRKRPPKSNRWIVPFTVTAIAAIVAGVALATVMSGNSSTPASSKFEVGTVVNITGTPLPKYPPTGPDPAIGMAAPVTTGITFDGAEVTVPGKGPSVLAIVAHWCPHCRAEMPRIMSLRRSGAWPSSVGLAGISTGVAPERGNYPPSAWFTRLGWDAPVLVDDVKGTADNAYGPTGFPFLVWLDANNKVVLRTEVEIPEATLARMLQQLAAGTTPDSPPR